MEQQHIEYLNFCKEYGLNKNNIKSLNIFFDLKKLERQIKELQVC